MFSNNAKLNDEHNTNMIKRYVHQPLTNDHYGIHFQIKENGKVVITGTPDKDGEFDEVEVPASLIFKLAQLLKATRTVQLVPVGSVSASEKEV